MGCWRIRLFEGEWCVLGVSFEVVRLLVFTCGSFFK